MPALGFWALAGAVLVAAFAAVSAGPSPLRSSLSLASVYTGLAALFALLGAPLLGAAQLVVAAVNGLALFLLEASAQGARRPVEAVRKPLIRLAGAVLVVGLVASGGAIVYRPLPSPAGGSDSVGAGSLSASLYSDHLLAVYLAALILSAAVVATLVLSRGRSEG